MKLEVVQRPEYDRRGVFAYTVHDRARHLAVNVEVSERVAATRLFPSEPWSNARYCGEHFARELGRYLLVRAK